MGSLLYGEAANASAIDERPAASATVAEPGTASYRFVKRVADFVVAGVALLLLLPLFVAIALAILSRDGWPVLFSHRRVGKGGRPIHVLKFRTMVRDAEQILQRDPKLRAEFEREFKLEHDPRVTPLGRFMRATTLDELPQLINVLRGDMSLVGVRPIVEAELEKYGEHAPAYLSMSPGCTGPWQCGGRSETTYAERVAIDVDYHRRASLLYDAVIVLKTVRAVLLRKGAR